MTIRLGFRFVTGVVERRQGVVNVIARHVAAISADDYQAGADGEARS